MSVLKAVQDVTDRIAARSAETRRDYLDRVARAREAGVYRSSLSCGNLAHAFAASGEDKSTIRDGGAMNIGIVTAFNDMLSLSLDGENLNNPTLKYYALNQDQPRAFYKNGSQYYLTLRAKF